MCRLFGVVANRSVQARFSLLDAPTSMSSLSIRNRDGWGIGWYEKGKALRFREPTQAGMSPHYSRSAQEITSNLIISHVRLGTKGDTNVKNTHPFLSYNTLFAHNGGIADSERLKERLRPEFRRAIEGGTDSEIYFQWIRQHMEDEHGMVSVGVRKAISALLELTESYSGLNFLMADGKNLYALRFGSGSKGYYSLYYLERDPESEPYLHASSEETRQLIDYKSMAGERALIVASERMTSTEPWKEVRWGHMITISSDLAVHDEKVV